MSVGLKGEHPESSQLHSIPQHMVNTEMLLCIRHGQHSAGDSAAGTTMLGQYTVKQSLSSQTSIYAQLNV